MQSADSRGAMRYTSEVPITLQGADSECEILHLHDISLTGLSLLIPHPLSRGESVKVSVEMLGREFSARASVIWCHHSAVGYTAGLKFLEPQSELTNELVNQICDIEQYRLEMRSFGQRLSSEEAQRAWMKRHQNYEVSEDDMIPFNLD